MAQQAAHALKQRETARRMARLAFVRQKRDEAVLRAIVGQLRIQHVEPDYPVCTLSVPPRSLDDHS